MLGVATTFAFVLILIPGDLVKRGYFKRIVLLHSGLLVCELELLSLCVFSSHMIFCMHYNSTHDNLSSENIIMSWFSIVPGSLLLLL